MGGNMRSLLLLLELQQGGRVVMVGSHDGRDESVSGRARGLVMFFDDSQDQRPTLSMAKGYG